MKFARLLLAAAALCTAPWAAAQPYPSKPITLVSPYAAGSSIDIIARLIAKPLSEQLGQQVVVVNKVGGGGDVGVDSVAKAPKDGYTIGFGAPGPITVNPGLKRNQTFNPTTDLAPITLVATGPNLLLVNPELPVKNLQELVDYAKKNPGKVNYGSPGVSTSGHLAGELLKYQSKAEFTHIPYKGNSEAINDAVAGHTQMIVTGVPPVLGFIQSGKLRPIAVADFKRSPLLPDVPTVAEAGMPGAESIAWYGVFAPAGTPKEILDRLNQEIVKAVKTPEIQAQFQKLGIDPAPNTPEQFADMIARETAKWKQLFANTKIVIE